MPPPPRLATRIATRFSCFRLRAAAARGLRLIDGSSASSLAQQLQTESGAPLCEVFAFLSSLYFRGKLAYARAFARPPHAMRGVFIVTPGAGLCTKRRLSPRRPRRVCGGRGRSRNPHFVAPLLRDVQALVASASSTRASCCSAASLRQVRRAAAAGVRERLLFPADFVGRGDMSRGGLCCAPRAKASELDYLPVLGATRHGPRAARLPRIAR